MDLGIWAVSSLIKYGTAHVKNENEKKKLAKSTFQILTYAGMNSGILPEHNKTIIYSVMKSMPISGKKDKKF